MKKGTKIAIIIAVIIAVIVLGTVLMFAFAKDKTAITAEEFKDKMEAKGYVIGDVTEQFEEYKDYIKKAYIAANEEITYQIEFYEILNSEYASSFFSLNKQVFENLEKKMAAETSVNLKNYSVYTLSTDSKYRVLSRIDNTVVYINVDNQYKDVVKSILEELGY